tara:strand:+ start:392 stop:814 length:423 start_codon:yes stop_codon:yes gene_type:complete
MIELIKMVDGVARAYSTAAFRADNKHTVYGASISSRHLAAQDVHRVRAGVKPAEAVGFKIVQEPFPVLVDGVWVHGYVSVALDEAEARSLRNELLTETDWAGNSDVVMSDELAAYRSALRDVPAQAGFPETITWPKEPST